MKKFVLALALIALVGVSAPSSAQVWGVPDVAPGSSLLLPYFEVDLDEEFGTTTLFSINNASATAILGHVTFWSDWSQHTLDFNVYLTGYDVVTVNIRDVFNGFLPVTASDGQDPTDTISPHGDFSQDINFASCNNFFPFDEPELGPFNLDLIRLGHTGQPVPDIGGLCVGENHGDNVARGYVTVDTVNQCTTAFADTPGYFIAGGGGIATAQNVLWGDFFIVNPGENFSFGDALVHLQATNLTPGAPYPGILAFVTPDTPYTFYGRYVLGTGADGREPLGTAWAARYLNGGAFDGGTELIAWRDSTAGHGPFGRNCVVGPDWFPLNQRGIVIFDEEENPVVPEGCQISPCPPEEGLIPFPLETQRVAVGGPALSVPFNFGWIYFDLNFAGDDAVAFDVDFGGDGQLSQSYMLATHSAEGRFQVGHPATMLASALRYPTSGIPGGGF